jgi:CRISPR-associated protein Cmr5
MANQITQRQKLEQGRANFAFERATTGYSIHKKEYAQHAKKLPMMIKTNGLGAAFAFMFSKQKTWGTLLKDIEDWIKNTDNKKTEAIYKDAQGSNLVQKVLNLNSSDYRVVTIEVLAFINWLSRFAEGIKKGQEIKDKAAQQQKNG